MKETNERFLGGGDNELGLAEVCQRGTQKNISQKGTSLRERHGTVKYKALEGPGRWSE